MKNLFRKYPSIDNSYRIKTINEIRKFGFDADDNTWIVLNKIHGANFSLWCNGKEILPAKRSGFILGSEKFSGYKGIVEKYKLDTYDMWEYFKEKLNYDVVLAIYGELFGGSYDHKDVTRNSQSTRVQKGVFYTPDNEFYVYEIMVDGRYISHTELEEICKNFGFIYAVPMFSGTFNECLEYNPVFEDPLHKEFNLPDIEDNKSEGYVMKPDIPMFFPIGSRAILKNKNPDFSEKTRSKKKIRIEQPEHIKERIASISQYVNKNRLRNVLSHGLNIGQKDFGVLMKEFTKDIVSDYEKDNGDIHSDLENKKEEKVINKAVNKLVSTLIRVHFQNIIDGEF